MSAVALARPASLRAPAPAYLSESPDALAAIAVTLRPAGIATYMAEVDGRALVTSRQPFYDGARVLLREGIPADTRLTARHAGSKIVALESTVGEAAKWSVEERDRGGLRRVAWKPYSSDGGVPKNARSAAGLEEGPGEASAALLGVSRPTSASLGAGL